LIILTCDRRFLISQNAGHIFISIATFDDNYVHHLKHSPNKPLSFLAVTMYGPFTPQDRYQLQIFASFILAFTKYGVPAQAVPDQTEDDNGGDNGDGDGDGNSGLGSACFTPRRSKRKASQQCA
jgi:hypothetical protein